MVDFQNAQPADIPAIADLYQKAFPEALDAVFGQPRIPSAAAEDVFSVLYRIEPKGFFVARDTEQRVGCVVVTSSQVAVKRALFWMMGPLLSRWLRGKYRGLGFAFIPNLIRAAWNYRKAPHPSRVLDPMGQIWTVIVGPKYQRQGIAARLTELSLAYLKTTPAAAVRLEVDAAKAGPIHVYQKFGFHEIGRIPSPRGPALVMTLALK